MAKNRKHGIIDDLPQSLKDTVEQMLLANCRYSDVVNYLQQHSVAISPASVCRFARNFQANVERLRVAQENFRRMTEELDKYPGMDTTEAILRIASQHVMDALGQMPEDNMSKVSFDKLLREASGLVKAAAYKKNIDVQVKERSEVGFDAVKQLIFEALAKERPDLYQEVMQFINVKKSAVESTPAAGA